jgi:hypothetical protein
MPRSRATATFRHASHFANAARRSVGVERTALRPRASVLTPEDVILHKPIAGRSQDLVDSETILAAKIGLDESYIERWCEFWDVVDSWKSLR